MAVVIPFASGSGGGASETTELDDVNDTPPASPGMGLVWDGAEYDPVDIVTAAELITALASYQPLDADLTAIAALTTTATGRSLLAAADAAALRTIIGSPATAHTHAQSDITNLVTDLGNKQPLDSDLTAIAALTTAAYGRSLLEAASAAAARTLLDVPEDDGQIAKKDVNNNFTATQDVTGNVNATTGLSSNANVVADADGGANKVLMGPGVLLFGAGFGDASLTRNAAGILATQRLKIDAAAASDEAVRLDQLTPANIFTAIVAQGSDLAVAGTALNNTDLVFTFVANSRYIIDLYLLMTSAAATTGYGFAFDTSVAVDIVAMNFFHALAATGTVSGGDSIADDTARGLSSGVQSTTLNPIQGMAIIDTGANGGTARLRVRSEVAAASVFKAGSTMRVMKSA